MVTLTYKHLNGNLPHLLGGLVKTARVAPKVAYTLLKLHQAVQSESKTARELFLGVAKKHALLDEKGEFVPLKDEKSGRIMQMFQVPEDKQPAFEKECDDLLSVEFKVDQRRVSLAELGETKLTAADISDLEPLLHDLEVVPSGQTA